jgi:hypothetical protein
MNGFAPWFPDLVTASPMAVKRVLTECILAEWEIAQNDTHTNFTLSNLAWTGGAANTLVLK